MMPRLQSKARSPKQWRTSFTSLSLKVNGQCLDFTTIPVPTDFKTGKALLDLKP
jgi:hypothetical protein